jgi:hypothetical protein
MLRRVIPFFLWCGVMSAGPCVVGTMASYEILGAAGCNVGPLRYFNFALSIPSAFENDTQILVTPVNDPVSPGLSFSGFLPVTNSTVIFNINYSIDPPPIIVRQLLDGDPPTGTVLGIESFCINQLFGGGANCADNSAPFQLQINNANPPNSLSNSFNFPVAESTLDLRTVLTVGNGSGTSSIDDLIMRTTVTPEPATLGLTGVALIALGVWMRRAAALQRRCGARLKPHAD